MQVGFINSLKSTTLAFVLIMGGLGLQDHLGIGIDLQKERCLKGSPWLFVILKGTFHLKTGDLVAFHSDARMKDHYPIGTTFIKRIEAIHEEGSGTARYWVIGDHPKSYDSRAYGAIEEAQLICRAYALF
jgi:hypothetical protein